MFSGLKQLPDDPILRLGALFAADVRESRVDVGVGVFQDENGHTAIMRAVKKAEERVWQQEESKKYLGLAGNLRFNRAMVDLVLAEAVDSTRVQAIQSVAGTGGLRLVADVLGRIAPEATVWLPNPTWGNHKAIFQAAGLKTQSYSYYDEQSGTVAMQALLDDLAQAKPKDIVVLHGCCHNPTGADLSPAQWQQIAALLKERQLMPIVDLAYLGFGQNLDDDAYGVRHLASVVDYLWVVVSCSKNFGLYRERTGVVLTVAPSAQEAELVQSYLAASSRAMVSMPPNHGAEIVGEILTDAALSQQWRDELAKMADYIKMRRQQLALALNQLDGKDWSFITKQQGMFSVLPLGEARVQALREDYGVYMVGAGRINFAGLKSEAAVEYVAQSIAKVQ